MSVVEITTTQYHDDDTGDGAPTLSSSIANLLLRHSAAHAFAAHPRLGNTRPRRHSDAFDLGDAVHGVLLEGDGRIVQVDAADWKTKAAQAERAAAREAGMNPLLISQAERVYEMVAAIRRQIGEFDADPPLLDPAGRPEVPVVWEENGVRCRALLDWLHPLGLEVPTVDDVKTTSGNGSPESWSRGGFFSFGYDVQAAFHSRGLRAAAGGAPRTQFRFIVAETDPPYEISVFSPGEDVLAIANAKVELALRTWSECLASGRWPGYPRRIGTIEIPPWEEARFLEREARDG